MEGRILKKWDGEALTGLIRLRIGTGAVSCECGNERLTYIKFREIVDELSIY
jgi:hypothetical protein